MIRKFLVFLLVIVVFAPLNSCRQEDSFDESLLYGRWREARGTQHYRYDSNGRGVSWDPEEDYDESEGLPFTWELKKSSLSECHDTGMGTCVPRNYTVTELTSSTLRYKDNFRSYTYTKIP